MYGNSFCVCKKRFENYKFLIKTLVLFLFLKLLKTTVHSVNF